MAEHSQHHFVRIRTLKKLDQFCLDRKDKIKVQDIVLVKINNFLKRKFLFNKQLVRITTLGRTLV